MVVKSRKTNKKPPVFSHEFIIQNHADIVSCVMVVFVFGMIVPLTSSVCNIFVTLQYPSEIAERIMAYGIGLKDICTVFFYSLLCIILHAVQQEYVLDKITKKLHLSKIKTSMFNESGQLLVFHLLSIVWSADLIIKEDLLLNLRSLWEDYPHVHMPFMMKFFYIAQMAYYVHCFPELYFSKVKRDEIPNKIQFALVRLFYVVMAYALNFNRVGILLFFLHYLSDGFCHCARMFDIVDKAEKNSKVAYMVSDIVFALSRIGTIILSIVIFFGLYKNENIVEKNAEGNHNSLLVQVCAFALIGILQIYLLFFFLKNHLQQFKEIRLPILKQSNAKNGMKFSQKFKKNRKTTSESDLTEADQSLKQAIPARTSRKLK